MKNMGVRTRQEDIPARSEHIQSRTISASETLAAKDSHFTLFVTAATTLTLPASGLAFGWKVVIYKITSGSVSVSSPSASINGASGSKTITGQWKAAVVENYGDATTSQFVITGDIA